MASLTGNLVAETYKALLKTIDNDILTASEKQITDGLGGGSNVFIDSNGFLRANKYKVTNGLATQFLKADGSLDANTYLTSITGAQVITALGYTPVTDQRTLTINGVTYNLTANRSWTVAGTAAVWGNITGTLSNQTDLQAALNAKFNVPAGTISQYIRGDGTLATFPTLPGGLPIGGTAGQILAKIDATDYNAQWIDNFATQTKNEVKLAQNLAKGAAVYVSSANGTNMIVSAASNASESLSSKTFGLLETGGVTNDLVKCVTFGLLAGLDTSTAQAGDPVWLGVNGALLFGVANKPVAPANMVYIGVVTRVQQNNGEIFVNVQNGFEIEELHDVLIQSKANNQGLFYESSTGLWKNKSIATVLGYTPQAQLDGTGFVKASGTTISYDNSTYLTTADAASTYQLLTNLSTDLTASATKYPSVNAVIAGLATKQPLDADLTAIAELAGTSGFLIKTAANTWSLDTNTYLTTATAASTYQRLDKMVSNLLASDTEYPNSNAVIAALALKANSANPVFTGNMTISGAEPKLFFTDTDNNPDYTIFIDSGIFYIYDQTAGATRFSIGSTGNISAGVGKSITAGSFVKESGTAAQFLKADGSIDSSTYVTSASLANYLLITTAASTYQRLDKMVSNLLASDTEYPNSNAVLAKLALKADAANPVFTGDLSISGATPRLYFVDTDQNPDYTVFIDSGFFYIYDQTAGATRFSINSSGNISTGTGKSITAGSFVKDGGTASQFLMADGSVTTGVVTGSGTTNYLPKWTSASALGNSIAYDNGSGLVAGSGTINSIPIWMKFISTDATQSGLGSVYNNKAIYIYTNSATIKLDAYDYATNTGLDVQIGGNGGNILMPSGSLLIGNPSFSYSANSLVVYANKTGNAGISIDNALASGSATTSLFLYNAGSLKMRFDYNRTDDTGIIGSATSIPLTFWTNNSEKMRLTNVGYLGINTSPIFRFHVVDNQSSWASVSDNSNGVENVSVYNAHGGGYGLAIESTSNDAKYIFKAMAGTGGAGKGSVPVIYALSNGNVGIGTTTPLQSYTNRTVFTVNGTSQSIINLGVGNSLTTYLYGTTSGSELYSTSTLALIAGGANALTVYTNGLERMRTTSDGAFIVGATSMTYAPSIGYVAGFKSSFTGQSIISIARAGQSLASQGLIVGIDSTQAFLWARDNVDVVLANNDLARVTIKSNGCTLVASDTSLDPVFKLQVGNGGADTRALFNSNNPYAVSIRNGASSLWYLGVNAQTASNGFQLFSNQGGVAMTLTTGNLIGLSGNTTPEYRLDLCPYNAETPTDVIRFGVNNGPGGGGGTALGTGIIWKPFYSGYTRRSAGIMQIAENNYFRAAIGFFTNDNANQTSDWSERFRIHSAGNATFYSYVTATAYYESSDLRLKKLIEHNPIIAGIENLQAKLYEKNGKIELGYFAQDAELIMPYSVTKNADGFLNLSYREIHTAKIARLEKEVAELKEKLNVA